MWRDSSRVPLLLSTVSSALRVRTLVLALLYDLIHISSSRGLILKI